MKNKILLFSIILSILIAASSCKKYLDAKPDKSLVVPQSLEDLQALLDNNSYMNLKSPSLAETSADNYFLNSVDINSLYANERNAYLWDTANYYQFPNDWALCYQTVYFSNIVLDNISKIDRTLQNGMAWDNVKGSALFFRAKSFVTGIWTWAKGYDSSSAKAELGIPLRLTEDFNTPSIRANLQESYDQIISDLQQAIPLLPVIPLHVMRPSKPAAYALLARVYLSMRKYDSCFKYADSCLKLKNTLIDYNSLSPTDPYPVPRFNDEVIFQSTMGNFYYNLFIGRIDTLLYASYSDNDLRREIYFKELGDGNFTFRGSYDNSIYPFDGVATDEVYLMRAEMFARAGNTNAAMNDLNSLLVTRWRTTTFMPYQAINSADALNQILLERRKELLWRNLRWIDIKRLNKENANISISRMVNNQVFTLKPNDDKYALPLPADIIELSGMPQNAR